MTWLRRNWIALLALPVLIIGLGAPDIDDLYGRFVRFKPALEIDGIKGQTVHLGQTTVQLLDVARIYPVDPENGDPITVPAGYAFWRVRMSFTVTTPDDLTACEVTIEDQTGRRFGADPHQLALTSDQSGGCLADDDTALSFDNVFYYLLPPQAKPAAIRLVPPLHLLPHYVRFSV
jgi:hypothetical protein